MIVNKRFFLSAIDSLKAKANTQEETSLLNVLGHIAEFLDADYDFDFVDLVDQNRYLTLSGWTGTSDVLEAVSQYYDDEDVFDGFDARMNACKEIAASIDWEELGYTLNCKGYDVVCQAIDEWLLKNKEGKHICSTT